jgi:hypothetical protein
MSVASSLATPKKPGGRECAPGQGCTNPYRFLRRYVVYKRLIEKIVDFFVRLNNHTGYRERAIMSALTKISIHTKFLW